MRNRIRILSAIGIFIVLVFIGRLFYLQIIYGDNYTEEADRQYVSNAQKIFNRGMIYFQTKEDTHVSAATLVLEYKLIMVPIHIENAHQVYQQLQPWMTLSEQEFLIKAQKPNDQYEELATGLSKEDADAIQSMNIKGVHIEKYKKRSYPGNNLAAQVIGFLAYDGDQYIGRYGLEKFYEATLKRTDPNLYVNFFAEVFSDVSSLLRNQESQEGDLILTIEPQVQAHLESTLDTIQQTWNSDAVGGIILDPQTGAVYAMGYTPTFDLNNYREVNSVSLFNNVNVQSVFEMGSTIKPIIMASALDTGSVTAETSYFDKGSVVVGDRTIWNFDKKGRGQTTMQGVLNESLNTGMVFVAQKMGKKNMREYLERFGFTEKTNIDLPGEVKSLTGNLESNRDVEYANMSFGQGIAVSPIRMASSLAVLANGGHTITPYVVQKIEYTNGFSDEHVPELGERVIREETAREITRMLVEIVDTTLLNGKAKLDYYSIAAKTGTAQMARPEGGYYTDRNMHTFFGYFPAYKPKFLIFLYTSYPKGAKYSSQTLAHPFMELAQFLLNYYEVPPDRAPGTVIQ